jgi:hypothetical protein
MFTLVKSGTTGTQLENSPDSRMEGRTPWVRQRSSIEATALVQEKHFGPWK